MARCLPAPAWQWAGRPQPAQQAGGSSLTMAFCWTRPTRRNSSSRAFSEVLVPNGIGVACLQEAAPPHPCARRVGEEWAFALPALQDAVPMPPLRVWVSRNGVDYENATFTQLPLDYHIKSGLGQPGGQGGDGEREED